MRQVMSFMRGSVFFLCWSVASLRWSVASLRWSVVCHALVSCRSCVSRFPFMRFSVVCHVLVCFLSPAKLLTFSGFVIILPHSFCFFSLLHPHFFLFSQDGNSTHNTHNIHHFTENQVLGSQHSHNKTPTRSQHLTTLPRVTRKCCELL